MLEKLSNEDREYVIQNLKIDLEDRSEEEIKIAIGYILERRKKCLLLK